MYRQKDAKTVQGCALKTRSPCCAGYEFIFRLPPKNKSVLHADGLKKSLRRIFIAAALERRTANHHPCPRLKGRELWGKLSKYFTVCKTASSANRSPCRLAVPEKIFALLACSIFSTATDAPPRCIRHWRRSAPHPHPPRPPHPQICIINPSCNFPAKSTIYVISTQHFPIM